MRTVTRQTVTAKQLANLGPQWKPGQPSPNPAGRPKGSRAKLQELAVSLLHADFAVHGEKVIARVRERKPEVYLASVVSLLPKQAQKVESPFIDLTDAELEQLEQMLTAIRAKTVTQLDLEPEPDPTPTNGGTHDPPGDDR
jgi:hypothetical protein